MAFVLRRLMQAALTVFATLTVVFALVHVSGNPVGLYLPVTASSEQVRTMEHLLGFDRPLYVQYAAYVWSAAHGDLGASFSQSLPALPLVLDRLPNTLYVTLFALGMMIVVAIPLGIASATRSGSPLDFLGSGVAVFGQSVPVFWLGLVLVLVFGVNLKWFPTFGSGGLRHVVLPGVTLGTYSMGVITRLVRSSMLDTYHSDYLRTARAKGLPQARVILKHALPNAILPALTMIGLQVAYLLSGAIVTEQVFSYPGMGQLVLQAINARDFNVVQSFVMVVAAVTVLVNTTTDITYSRIDPRMTYG
ncbi:MAG TPA: ABC transporter permease [bacterium]|nr:ABC transporter permease [bacterium]